MKPKTEKPKAEIEVTSKAKLTIKGVVHNLTLEELRAVYETIGKTLGESSKDARISDLTKQLAESRAREGSRNHPYRDVPQWPRQPIFVQPTPNPLDPPYRITCEGKTPREAFALSNAQLS